MSIKTPVRQGDRWHIYDAEEAHVCCCNREEQAAEIVTAVNSLPTLVAALREAKRELNCLIDQAAARGYTSGGPKRVIEQIDEALKGTTHA